MADFGRFPAFQPTFGSSAVDPDLMGTTQESQNQNTVEPLSLANLMAGRATLSMSSSQTASVVAPWVGANAQKEARKIDNSKTKSISKNKKRVVPRTLLS